MSANQKTLGVNAVGGTGKKRELAITKAVEYIMSNVKEKAAKKAKKDEAEVATEE